MTRGLQARLDLHESPLNRGRRSNNAVGQQQAKDETTSVSIVRHRVIVVSAPRDLYNTRILDPWLTRQDRLHEETQVGELRADWARRERSRSIALDL